MRSDYSINVRVGDPEGISDRLYMALQELAVAVAEDQSGDDVEGFAQARARLHVGGARPSGAMKPEPSSFCFGYEEEFGNPTKSSCWINF